MLTRNQKIQKIKESEELLQKSRSLIFIDFGGASVSAMEKLRKNLRESDSKLKIVKKRLLNLAFANENIDFNPTQFELQVGTVFSPKEIYEAAMPVGKSEIKILGGYDIATKEFFDGAKIKFFANLPTKEILLGQLAGILAAPIRMFLYVLNEKGRKENAEVKNQSAK